MGCTSSIQVFEQEQISCRCKNCDIASKMIDIQSTVMLESEVEMQWVFLLKFTCPSCEKSIEIHGTFSINRDDYNINVEKSIDSDVKTEFQINVTTLKKLEDFQIFVTLDQIGDMLIMDGTVTYEEKKAVFNVDSWRYQSVFK